MKLVYLFSNFNSKREIQNILGVENIDNNQSITINDTNMFNKKLIEVNIANEDINTAKLLSKIHSTVTLGIDELRYFDQESKKEVVCIQDDASKYFISQLCSHIGDFERKFRKLLNLCVSITDVENNSALIENISNKKLEQIFEALFKDESFVNETKSVLSDRNFSKELLMEALNSVEEENAYINLFQDEVMPTIRERSFYLMDIRKTVQNAKDITSAEYDEANDLYIKAIEELDSVLEIIKDGDFEKVLKSEQDFNFELGLALNDYDVEKTNDHLLGQAIVSALPKELLSNISYLLADPDSQLSDYLGQNETSRNNYNIIKRINNQKLQEIASIQEQVSPSAQTSSYRPTPTATATTTTTPTPLSTTTSSFKSTSELNKDDDKDDDDK